MDNTSTALFSAAQDILIDKSVGAPADSCPVPEGQLQGFFSADRNFTVHGINDCVSGKDVMLNIDGSIILNAAGQGGTFINQRDLCADDQLYPSLTVQARLDLILNAPNFLKEQQTISHEVVP